MSKDDKSRGVPTGRFGRFTRLAGLGARTGAAFLTGGTKAAVAEQAAEVLGNLRGLAAKVGQMASYVDGMVPDEHRDSFEGALGRLRAAAVTSSPDKIRDVVEEDLGGPIDQLFASFELEPFASASIGQVHRATLQDGREVAVKVQHPGIRDAVEADLKNAGIIEGMVGAMGARKLNSKGIFEEIQERFREELDYELEASRQREFAVLHRGDPTIRIPEVIAERSSARVLTSEFVSGTDLEAVSRDSEDERRKAAETLWRFVFKGNLVGGKFNADPHPGNYVFHGNGVISFLDFGCVQPIEGERKHLACELHVAALEGDEARFDHAARAILHTDGGRYEEMAVEYSRRCFVPIFDSPFRIDREFSKSLVEGIKAFKKEAFSLKKNGKLVPLPKGMLFMNRLQFGFYSVLARLDVEVDYREVERRFMAEAGLV